MKSIIFIETNKSGSSREGIKAAEQLGYYTVLITSKKKLVKQREEFPDVHKFIYLPKITKKKVENRLEKFLGYSHEIKAIISFIDNYVALAAQLCISFCNRSLSVKAIQSMEDKAISTEVLNGLEYSPTSHLCKNLTTVYEKLDNYTIPLPFVMKAPNSTGSKDVLLVNKREEIKDSFNYLKKKYPNKSILIEEFISGPQYLIEGVVHKGKLAIVAIIKQEITFKDRFIITGYQYLANVEEPFYYSLEHAVNAIITKFEMDNGSFHMEMRRSTNGWKLIEINPRISGSAMNLIILNANGINLAKETVALYLGDKPNLVKEFEQPVFAQFLTVDKQGRLSKVTGKSRASNCEGICSVYIKPKKGQLVTPPMSMGHRYAYVIAKGETEEQAKERAKNAAAEIKFHIMPSKKEGIN
ncbi:ATP-grasp domain-containing protein [Aquibacillus salsiterrae]|uniref:ATP-grasp domain-containing protein n=1 Tax=Aquibacillus salsiterrae TaxID=2950439 RepID=A0A9X3WDR3_9BACI|nr:ATP-grasp domain-containing protein [Aquibacillus salsiterrae]MDC3416586.1 ATP-grasp domain-containing protein [Aquibacillus salsiterrae]